MRVGGDIPNRLNGTGRQHRVHMKVGNDADEED